MKRTRSHLGWLAVLASLVPATDGAAAECDGAGTPVPGPFVVNQTWTKAGSPYRVTADITVGGLTIEPGVCVLVDGPFTITVAAPLLALGSPANPILFTEKDAADDWKGILFQNSPPGSILEHCTISGATNSGIRVVNSNPQISHCLITGNRATNGGGININNTGIDLLVSDTRIVSNMFSTEGGGVWASAANCTITLERCDICDNVDNANNVRGGGIYLTGGTGAFELLECRIASNSCVSSCTGFCSTSAHGGGLYINSGQVAARNCLLHDNLASASCSKSGFIGCTTVAFAGGCFLNGGALELIDCVVSCNTAIATCSGNDCGTGTADHRGGGIYMNAGTLTVNNCAIAHNNTHGLRRNGGVATVKNSILFYNNAGAAQTLGMAADSITYTCIQDGFPGIGNITFAPFFLDGDSADDCDCPDFRIAPVSSCVDAGDPGPADNDGCLPPGQGGVRSDMGASGGPENCGWSCLDPADVDCDEAVGVGDLVDVILHWGPCPAAPAECPWDVDCSGSVDVGDLVRVLVGWD